MLTNLSPKGVTKDDKTYFKARKLITKLYRALRMKIENVPTVVKPCLRQ